MLITLFRSLACSLLWTLLAMELRTVTALNFPELQAPSGPQWRRSELVRHAI